MSDPLFISPHHNHLECFASQRTTASSSYGSRCHCKKNMTSFKIFLFLQSCQIIKELKVIFIQVNTGEKRMLCQKQTGQYYTITYAHGMFQRCRQDHPHVFQKFSILCHRAFIAWGFPIIFLNFKGSEFKNVQLHNTHRYILISRLDLISSCFSSSIFPDS